MQWAWLDGAREWRVKSACCCRCAFYVMPIDCEYLPSILVEPGWNEERRRDQTYTRSYGMCQGSFVRVGKGTRRWC